MSPPRGLLLLNLGTPDAPRTAPVRRYLREFLGDPRVLDIPALGRWLLLNLVILPRRPGKSAAAYAKVWTERGSPLMVESEAFAAALSAELGEVPIEMGMRYGSPSVDHAVQRLVERGCDEIVVFALYPHYASSSTGTGLQAAYEAAARRWNVPRLHVLPPFHDDDGFLDSFAAVGAEALADFDAEHLVFSYHGLPERQVRKSEDRPGRCRFDAECCQTIDAGNRHCYRAQCYATTRGLLARLGHPADRATTSFQSRLGRTPWIRPYTDILLPELAAQGVRRVAVFCPSFVTDCLETLEEIGMRARDDFRAAGGEDLRLVPSLNAHPLWVKSCARMLGPFGIGALSSDSAPA